MRSIRERLQAMDPQPQTRTEPEPAGVPIDLVVPGSERETPRGRYYLIENQVPDPTYGSFVARERNFPAELDSTGALRTAGVSAGDLLFLDTETTGLDRGTGTHVFLVGVGYFDGSGFRVQQHFIRDLHEEASLLHDLSDLVEQFPILVTFNGRAFDWPLLYNRFILHGYRNLPELAHWDLLPFSRRVWKHRLRDCSLGNLERNILGVQRYGDVPGYLIPQLYFDYLRDRDARPLRPVFSHNQEDIVSLARLADLLLGAEGDPHLTLDHPVDRVSYGLHLLNNGTAELAERLICENLEARSLEPSLKRRACRNLATWYKRNRRWSDAIEIWRTMQRCPWSSAEEAIYPFIELAKVYEHKFRDYRSAMTEVERAMNLAALHRWSEFKGDLIHRYARLKRRTLGSSHSRTQETDGTGRGDE